VGGVAVPVVDVVGVALVRDGDMPALRTVLMVMPLMRCVLCGAAFVHMIPVDPVEVAVVRVVGVIAVLERDVAAVLAMGVRMIGVRGVLAGVRHAEVLLSVRALPSSPAPRAFPWRGTGEARLSI
jgi:hypothetical protein